MNQYDNWLTPKVLNAARNKFAAKGMPAIGQRVIHPDNKYVGEIIELSAERAVVDHRIGGIHTWPLVELTDQESLTVAALNNKFGLPLEGDGTLLSLG